MAAMNVPFTRLNFQSFSSSNTPLKPLSPTHSRHCKSEPVNQELVQWEFMDSSSLLLLLFLGFVCLSEFTSHAQYPPDSYSTAPPPEDTDSYPPPLEDTDSYPPPPGDTDSYPPPPEDTDSYPPPPPEDTDSYPPPPEDSYPPPPEDTDSYPPPPEDTSPPPEDTDSYPPPPPPQHTDSHPPPPQHTNSYPPPPDNGTSRGSSISAGVVVGIVAAVVVLLLLVLGVLWWKGCLRRKNTKEQGTGKADPENPTSILRGQSLQGGTFTLEQIKAATNNFDPANKIGEGGFGSVYKGLLVNGTIIAVKQLSSESTQGNREFLNEIGMISALHHPHLVKFYGCCAEGNHLMLVYEYMENNSLARALFGPRDVQLKLDWPTRHKICVGIARGLAYLHEESRLKIVHRDIKATNVLLDKDLTPKISDFGLAKLDEKDNTHINTRIAGTLGYMAPEYAMRGHLTEKADVYSFGVVALEIVSGKSNTTNILKDDRVYLLDWALMLKKKGNLMELVDPRLESNFEEEEEEEEVMTVIDVALLCTSVTPEVRPTMSLVVSVLQGRAHVEDISRGLSITSDEIKLKELRQYVLHHEKNSSEALIPSSSTEEPWTGSSTSNADLYPNTINSRYLKNRDN